MTPLSPESVVALVPARGGSKGLPGKNLRVLGDRPLIGHAIAAALGCKRVGRTIVSTDTEQIAAAAREQGAEVPFLRPAELAVDTTPMEEVVRHLLDFVERETGTAPAAVVVLQPTSPLRRPEHIARAIEILESTGCDSVVSVCEAEISPYWMKRVDEDLRVRPLLDGVPQYKRRQDLPKVYQLNGAVYAVRTAVFRERGVLLGPDTRALVMEQADSADIDSELDFDIAKNILARRAAATGGE